MSDDPMRILVVEPTKDPYVKEIDGSLASMQAIVGGFIQAVEPFDDPNVLLLCNEAIIMIVGHIQAGVPVVVKGAKCFAVSVHIDPVQLCRLPQIDIFFYDFKNTHDTSISAQKRRPAQSGASRRLRLFYAVFVSSSFLASRKAFFHAPCRLICAAYRQSSLQYFTSDLVVINSLPQFSQVHARLRLSAASCR